MRIVWQAVGVFIVTMVWWSVLAIVHNGPEIPPPWIVMPNMVEQLNNGLLAHVVASLLRILYSTILALLVAIPLGILIGYKKKWDVLLSPFIFFSYPVPKLALLPIIMLVFGLSEASKILLIFLIIFFPLVMDVISGVKGMDREVFEVMKTFGVRGRTICLHIILPGLLATILNSVKVTTGIALSVLFFAENYGTKFGMGYYIMNSWQRWNYVDLYTGVVALSTIGFMTFMLLDIAERKVARWR